MKISVFIPVLILSTILLLIDLFVFRGIIGALNKLPNQTLRIIKWAYWAVPIMISFSFSTLIVLNDMDNPKTFTKLMLIFGIVLLFYLPKLVFGIFQLSDDIYRLGAWAVAQIKGPSVDSEGGITRSHFLLQLGLVISAIPFVSVIHGVVKGRFNFRVVEQPLGFSNLPKAFNGFRLLQISDAHLGSFIGNEKKIEAAVELINKQNVDAVVFTGDIVNNLANELDTFVPIFEKIKAKEGKFSILGNHDYGTHHRWSSKAEKDANLQQLFTHHKNMGFRLLNNENVTFERNGEKIALLGVENWGEPPFPQYGDLGKAMKGAEDAPFKVLLSHDPTHWEHVVRKESNVDLTLSGHTHGMQFGIKIGNWQWSPVSLRYPRWAGLYQEGKQFLYVNKGFGVIGFPGRIGMDPELTVFELKKV